MLIQVVLYVNILYAFELNMFTYVDIIIMYTYDIGTCKNICKH